MSKKFKWVFDNIRKSARYNLIAELTKKKKETVKMFFFRNKLNISNEDDVKKYLKKFL